MQKRIRRVGPALALTMICLSMAAMAQVEPDAVAQMEQTPPAMRVLVVDGTKTFLSTMRIGGLVGALKGSGLFEVDVRFADVQAGWHDPLADQSQNEGHVPYDFLLAIPRGIDDASADRIWVLSAGPTTPTSPIVAGLQVIEQVLGLVFEGAVSPFGVHDDLLLGMLYEFYVAKGWMR